MAPAITNTTQTPRRFEISVRELVDFLLRTGDLEAESDFVSPNRAWEGTRGHQRLQKSRPPGYQAEVPVSCAIETEAFSLIVRGRLDGLMQESGLAWFEEIKTVRDSLPATPDPLHWAQLRCYAALCIPNQPADSYELRLTYLDIASDRTREFREAITQAEAQGFFQGVMREYQSWIERQCGWLDQRDPSLRALSFPFPAYRPGQRKFAVAVYRALANQQRLFAEAPTGIGKTVSVIVPALKVLGEQGAQRLFYLTAKTPGRMAAENTLQLLRSQGLRLRSIVLTARDKICILRNQICSSQSTGASNNLLPWFPESATDQPGVNAAMPPAMADTAIACDARHCPFAIGYYDRIKPALRDALAIERLDRTAIQNLARQHQVCPFELALDASLWADLIICDYNYVFDPQAFLRRFFARTPVPCSLLVDEAHNLLDRAREMFSAELDRNRLREALQAVGTALPQIARALRAIGRAWSQWHKSHEEPGAAWRIVSGQLPAGLIEAIRRFLREAEAWLAQDQPAPFRAELRQCYFELLSFVRISDGFDENYVVISEKPRQGGRLRLFCKDPSQRLNQAIPDHSGAVFFSGTLTPLEFFRDCLGGSVKDHQMRLGSPFPPEHLVVLVHHGIATTFKQRGASFGEVARAIAAFTGARPGKYLVFFPSYEYLQRVRESFVQEHPAAPVLEQVSGMTEEQRDSFLAAFTTGRQAMLIGFAVMGGVFGESIDLVGEQLSGAVIVGVGLPQLCLERDLIRNHFDRIHHAGFDYAYRYPGINRVLQAAGRVIRSETDRGALLLIDCRFSQMAYRRLLPDTWQITFVRSIPEIEQRLEGFWANP